MYQKSQLEDKHIQKNKAFAQYFSHASCKYLIKIWIAEWSEGRKQVSESLAKSWPNLEILLAKSWNIESRRKAPKFQF